METKLTDISGLRDLKVGDMIYRKFLYEGELVSNTLRVFEVLAASILAKRYGWMHSPMIRITQEDLCRDWKVYKHPDSKALGLYPYNK